MNEKLTVAQTADLLRVSERRVRQIARSGELPSVRELEANGVLGYRFDPADVVVYVPGPRGRRWPTKAESEGS